MNTIATVTWISTALIGTYMITRSVTASRDAAGATVTDLPVLTTFLHPSLAVTGLAVWGVYMVTHVELLAWIAFADLLLVAALGELLFSKWLHRRRHPVDPGSPVRKVTAEQAISIEVLAAHGVLAAATIVLVFLGALSA